VLKWKKMLDLKDAEIAGALRQFTNKDNIFVKEASFSIFDNKDFQLFLDKHEIKELYICGLDTHACVLVSAMDAFSKNYEVKVIEDLCGSSHGEKYHKAAIEILRSNLSDSVVIKSTDIQS
jgi:nicotinamidase-related amidase